MSACRKKTRASRGSMMRGPSGESAAWHCADSCIPSGRAVAVGIVFGSQVRIKNEATLRAYSNGGPSIATPSPLG